MTTIDFKALAEPFPKNEVKTLTKTWKDKKTGAQKQFSAPYITARHVMNRLDKVAGPENWRDEYEFLPGGCVMCTLFLCVNGEWIGKSDMGTLTDVEPEKGAVSDAFKRAAVRWGIGRELYNDGTAFDDDAPPARTAPNPRRIPDAPPTDNRLVKPEPAQTPDNGAADEGESHWTNDMARLRKFLAWAEDFWKPIERPHAVNRLANALGINGTPSGNKDLLFEMMLAQQDTVGTPDEAMRAVQLYEPATPPADVKLMPDKDAMPFDGPCDMCGETTVLTVAGGTFRCKACSDKVANEAASALAQKRGKGKKLEPTGTEG